MKPFVTPLSRESLLCILELTQKLAAPHNLELMLIEVVESGKSILNADQATLWLYEAQPHDLTMKVPLLDPPIKVNASHGLVGECFTRKEVINVQDCQTDSRFDNAVDLITGYQTNCLLSIPLIGFDNEMVGVMQLVNKKGGHFTEEDENLAMTLAAQCAVALQRTQMIDERVAKQKLDDEVAVARDIQMSTLPEMMPDLPGYDMSGYFRPADHTGGDLYDLVMIEDRLFVLLGDATGHGFGPALSATQMQAMLRVAFRVGADLDQAYIHVNNQMVEDLPDDRFLTAFMGLLDPISHEMSYHALGQGPVLHFKAHKNGIEFLKPTSFPLGIMDVASVDESHVIKLESGDILAVISDGIFEYESIQGEQFGEQRVADFIQSNQHLSMKEISNLLMEEVSRFAGDSSQQDDITMVFLKRLNELSNP